MPEGTKGCRGGRRKKPERNSGYTAEQTGCRGGWHKKPERSRIYAGGTDCRAKKLPQREATPIAVEKIQFGKDFFIPGVIF